MSSDAIAPKLAALLPPSQIIPYDHWTPQWQTAIASAYHADASSLLQAVPETVKDLAAIISLAHQSRWRLLVAGQGSKLGWGNPAQNIDLLLRTHRLNGLIDHAVGDMTVTAQAGMSFAQLQMHLAQQQQWIPLDPVYPAQATLGGILATRDAGSLRHRYGGVRDLCLGLTFVRADGQIAKAGGRVVKNVAGYDLMKLFAGSFGTLGIVTELTLRAYPLPEASGTVLVRGNETAIASLIQTLRQSTLTPTAFDVWTELQAEPGELTLTLRFQSLAESVLAQTQQVQALAHPLALATEVIQTDGDWWAAAAAALRESKAADVVLCQVGVLPSEAVSSLVAMQHKASQKGVALQGRIHFGSGVGQLQLTGENSLSVLKALRFFLVQSGGYLSVLEAPLAVKKNIDVWGYSGNALAAMRKLKERFDPQGGLNPGRFVGGI